MDTFAIVLYITLFSGGFRNLERGVQSLAREAHPKIFWLPCPLLSCWQSELNISNQLQTSGDQ